MAFIVKKIINDKEYYYLNENKREGKKVKTKTLAYLGKTRKDAEKKMKEFLTIKNKEIKQEVLNTGNFLPVQKPKVSGSQKIKDFLSPKMQEHFQAFNSHKLKNSKQEDLNMEKTENKIEEKKKTEKPIEIKEAKKEMKIGSKIDEITAIASKRGFFFQTANLYGGKAGFFTCGHLGKALKSNWEMLWRENILGLNDNFFEIQSNNILPEQVFKASGHLENFNDPMAECKKCHFRFRVDQFLEDKGVKNAENLTIEEMDKEIKDRKLKCPKCGGEIGEVRQFNMMFSVPIGFDNEKGYLSPETAQGAYITFKEEFQATRNKLPLGLAIIDKAYRNEISPRQLFFRLREFTQAELQIFFDPEKINEHEKWNEVKNKKLRIKFAGQDEIKEISCEELNKKGIPKFYLYHAAKVQQFYLEILKIPKEKFRLRELDEKERAFYNKIHFDVELFLDTLGGFKEVAGIHYRTDHDLVGHQKISGKSLEVFYDNKKILPHVLELSFGVDRNIFAILDIFYDVGEEGSMFKFPLELSPYNAAIFPLVKNEEKIVEIAENIYHDLKKEMNILYDESASIGRRYARQDEIGTPFCITIDYDSIKNKDVTIRERDTTKQSRIKISELKEILKKLANQEIEFEKIGKIVETRVK
ncbi:MAG: glycine--tRNA ligase [archaeon]|nr:glycine--tRNA ligase [archaeon]